MWEYLGSGLWQRKANPNIKQASKEEMRAWCEDLFKEIDEAAAKQKASA